MAEAAFEIAQPAPGQFALRGAMTFATAAQLLTAGERAFASAPGPSFELDCSGVVTADSAGLAVLIDWLASARTQQRHLVVHGVPDSLRVLARISELEELLDSGS
jgi:phospholipid transport system transporter-binding protein